MITFKAEIERFEKMGDKTGWTYILVPAAIAQQLKPDYRRSFRVKGHMDAVAVSGMAMVPMGEGDFILPLKSALRKLLHKKEGDLLHVSLEEHQDFFIEMPLEMEMCLSEESHLMDRFLQMPKSHQNYFINWFNTAKTENTKVKRLTMMVHAMEQGLDFGAMIRAEKGK